MPEAEFPFSDLGSMDKAYDFAAVETPIYKWWESSGNFKPSNKKGADPFTIVMPPPNVTGSLHLGHALESAIQDAVVRWRRMQGYSTLWLPGTDHAGIATQMVVERDLLQREEITRHTLGRDKFIERVWEWKEEYGGKIQEQRKRLGASCDWDRAKFTMDPGPAAAVRKTFVSLYKEGLIYRGNRMVNWCPSCQTALSDLEVIHEERESGLYKFKYPLVDENDHIIIATTRPETMLGDTAVAVNPDDDRYHHLVGKQVALPLTGRTIPIIADEAVDLDFGTGALKVTPAHDPVDFEIGFRHDLETITVIGLDGRMTADAGEYEGMDRFKARTTILEALDEQGLLVAEIPYRQSVSICDRSKDPVEPLSSLQWYVKEPEISRVSRKAVEDGEIKFVPERFTRVYFNWIDDLQDWCVSRQLWWGHRIPVWYCDSCGENIVEYEDPTACPTCDSEELTQDEDVLDTWFSSALWTFSTLGWPDEREFFDRFHPTDVLVTGFDIIFFWVARMIMLGLKFMDDVPFHEVYIHGLIRDQDGQKMSKSKGNVLDPIDLIDGVDLETLLEKRTAGLMQTHLRPQIENATRKQFPNGINEYGADALRFTFASLATTGRDIRFDLGRMEGYKNFCNKLWNASRYVLMNVQSKDDGEVEFSAADRWIRSRLGVAVSAAHEHFAGYRLDLVAQAVYEFTWHEFCDWYLELSKPVLQSDTATDAQKRGTRRTLIEVLEELLRLLHPLIPFVTEEIWAQVAPLAGKDGDTIMLQEYPVENRHETGPAVEEEIEWVRQFILGIRQIRGEMDISPGKQLPVLLESSTTKDREFAARNGHLLERVGRVESVTALAADEEAPASATALLGQMRLHVPLAGLIDIDAEKARLGKQRQRVNGDLERMCLKLDNVNFVNNAPADVVTKTRQQVAALELQISQLDEQIGRLEDST